VLDQNPGTDWRALLSQVEVSPDAPPAGGDIADPAPAQAASAHAASPAGGQPGDGQPGDGLESFRL